MPRSAHWAEAAAGIKGFGHIKARNLAAARERLAALRRAPAPTRRRCRWRPMERRRGQRWRRPPAEASPGRPRRHAPRAQQVESWRADRRAAAPGRAPDRRRRRRRSTSTHLADPRRAGRQLRWRRRRLAGASPRPGVLEHAAASLANSRSTTPGPAPRARTSQVAVAASQAARRRRPRRAAPRWRPAKAAPGLLLARAAVVTGGEAARRRFPGHRPAARRLGADRVEGVDHGGCRDRRCQAVPASAQVRWRRPRRASRYPARRRHPQPEARSSDGQTRAQDRSNGGTHARRYSRAPGFRWTRGAAAR